MNLFRSTLLLSLAATAPFTAHAASSAEQRIRGAAVFAGNGCTHCHTINHNGGTIGPNLSDVGQRLKEDQIRAQILHGSHQMPAFAEILQKAETDDLVAYLRSCRDKETK
ncbi:MAG TPA: cytochrome c [Edaphobacter sp.]|nr:cytochrome c [Edaphobacter sp.]